MPESQNQPTRRGFVLGAAVAGAATAAVVTLPQHAARAPIAQDRAPPAPARGGGYRLSEHVARYYRSTRL